jgi:hypothetical protein
MEEETIDDQREKWHPDFWKQVTGLFYGPFLLKCFDELSQTDRKKEVYKNLRADTSSHPGHRSAATTNKYEKLSV